MKYTIYKFNFQTGVHFGTGRLNETSYVFHADQFFSALYIEAIKMHKEDVFYQSVQDGKIVFSDAMPYIGKTYLIPKPMLYIQTDQMGSSKQKKDYKKMKYLPVDKLDLFLQGKMDVSHDPMKDFGNYDQRTMAEVRNDEDTKPYRVGTFYYQSGCGLYIIVGYEDEEILRCVENLIESLSYTGIGGKKSSGLGKFELIKGRMSEEIENRLLKTSDTYILLSSALPQDDELEEAMEDATYLLEKRAGFVAPAVGQNTSLEAEWQKKKDLYVFSAGSCFKKRFTGNVYDVSKGGYPVYRYARAMFLGV